MKIGIDLGNGWTKFDGMKFASVVTPGRLLAFNSPIITPTVPTTDDEGEVIEVTTVDSIHQIVYDEIPYIVGRSSDGAFTGPDRYYTDNYKICLLTAIALASEKRNVGTNNLKVDLCVGLPIDPYMNGEGVKVSNHIKEYKTQTIEVNGKEYTIQIKSVMVFPEGALTVKDGETSSVLTIDIGAGTVNVIEWEGGRPKKTRMLEKSMLNMYSEISALLTSLGASYGDREIEKILFSGNRKIIIKQKEHDINKQVNAIIESVVRSMVSEIHSKFTVKAIKKIKLLGGGAFITYNYWKKQFETVELCNNSQFVNSEIFDLVVKNV